VAPSLPYSSITAQSLATHTATTLPAGNSQLGNNITLLCVVSDVFDSSSNASFVVNVVLNATVNVGNVLGNSLAAFAASGDVNLLYQVVNNVASTINVVNCSHSPDCGHLHRHPCLTTPNTCESCLNDYIGIVGPANTKCLAMNSTSGFIGSSCLMNSDCLYELCVGAICVAPPLQCPTNIPHVPCSGNGYCGYFTSTDLPFEGGCTIVDISCTATCVCDSGWNGQDCSLDAAALAAANNYRTQLCGLLLTVAQTQSKSPQLLDSITGSLLQAYDPHQVTSELGKATCSEVLTFLAQTASEGYLKGTNPATTQFIVKTISSFASNPTGQSSTTSGAADAAVGDLTNGIFGTLVNGESPAQLVSENVRATIQKPLFSAMTSSAGFSPPQTAAEAAYGSTQPKLVFASNAFSACEGGKPSGYSELGVMQWGKNPYAGSSKVKSRMMRLTSTSTVSKKDHPHDRLLVETYNEPKFTNATPAYFISLQYSERKNLNFTALKLSPRKQKRNNFTLPACTIHIGNSYVPCHGCNISSFTDFNVTYACYDSSSFCPAQSNRRLQDIHDEDGTGQGWNVMERELQTNDDSPSNAVSQVLSYATLLKALLAELAAVMSTNPANIDWAKAKAILAFVSCIFFVWVAGTFIFLKWDAIELRHILYLDDEKKREQRRILNDHMAKTGKTLEAKADASMLSGAFQAKKGAFEKWLECFGEKRVDRIDAESIDSHFDTFDLNTPQVINR